MWKDLHLLATCMLPASCIGLSAVATCLIRLSHNSMLCQQCINVRVNMLFPLMHPSFDAQKTYRQTTDLCSIKVWSQVNSIRIPVCQRGSWRKALQAAFCVTHGGCSIIVHRSKVAVAINSQVHPYSMRLLGCDLLSVAEQDIGSMHDMPAKMYARHGHAAAALRGQKV